MDVLIVALEVFGKGVDAGCAAPMKFFQ